MQNQPLPPFETNSHSAKPTLHRVEPRHLLPSVCRLHNSVQLVWPQVLESLFALPNTVVYPREPSRADDHVQRMKRRSHLNGWRKEKDKSVDNLHRLTAQANYAHV